MTPTITYETLVTTFHGPDALPAWLNLCEIFATRRNWRFELTPDALLHWIEDGDPAHDDAFLARVDASLPALVAAWSLV